MGCSNSANQQPKKKNQQTGAEALATQKEVIIQEKILSKDHQENNQKIEINPQTDLKVSSLHIDVTVPNKVIKEESCNIGQHEASQEKAVISLDELNKLLEIEDRQSEQQETFKNGENNGEKKIIFDYTLNKSVQIPKLTNNISESGLLKRRKSLTAKKKELMKKSNIINKFEIKSHAQYFIDLAQHQV